MPIEYKIDHARRLVMARGMGVFTDSDVFAYQQEVWTQPEVADYDELMDMTDVEAINIPKPAGPRLQELAAKAAVQDPVNAGRFAIVAPTPIAFGLAREFQIYRELDPRSRKQIGVFQTLTEALMFLGIETLDGNR